MLEEKKPDKFDRIIGRVLDMLAGAGILFLLLAIIGMSK